MGRATRTNAHPEREKVSAGVESHVLEWLRFSAKAVNSHSAGGRLRIKSKPSRNRRVSARRLISCKR
eukprot:649236-Pleurochrysis_carterae.AAC.1